MRFNKKIVVFSLILILILSLSAVVRAAPPRGRSMASDHLDLNALEKAGLNNLLADQKGSGEDPSEDDDTFAAHRIGAVDGFKLIHGSEFPDFFHK